MSPSATWRTWPLELHPLPGEGIVTLSASYVRYFLGPLSKIFPWWQSRFRQETPLLPELSNADSTRT